MSSLSSSTTPVDKEHLVDYSQSLKVEFTNQSKDISALRGQSSSASVIAEQPSDPVTTLPPENLSLNRSANSPRTPGSGTCVVGNCFNALQTVDEDFKGPHSMLADSDLYRDCVLWDDKCTGNITSAQLDFFDEFRFRLFGNKCFRITNTDTKLIQERK